MVQLTKLGCIYEIKCGEWQTYFYSTLQAGCIRRVTTYFHSTLQDGCIRRVTTYFHPNFRMVVWVANVHILLDHSCELLLVRKNILFFADCEAFYNYIFTELTHCFTSHGPKDLYLTHKTALDFFWFSQHITEVCLNHKTSWHWRIVIKHPINLSKSSITAFLTPSDNQIRNTSSKYLNSPLSIQSTVKNLNVSNTLIQKC